MRDKASLRLRLAVMRKRSRSFWQLLSLVVLPVSVGACATEDASPEGPGPGAGGSTSGVTTGSGGGDAGAGGEATSSSAGAGGSGAGGGAPADNGQWVLGYYVGYQINDYPIAEIDWSALTHIAFAGIQVKDDLTLDLSFFDENGTGPEDAKALSDAAHAHGVKALILLGGQGAGPNLAVAASPPHRDALVSQLLDAVETFGYDGLDLDWEENIDMDDFIALAEALRAAKPGILLTYPTGMINANYPSVDPKMVTLAASLDRVMIQSYYPSTALSGYGWESWFNSPLSGATDTTPAAIDDTLQRLADAGIPKAKLGMGVGFYAICYTGGISGPHQPTNGGSQQIVGGDNDYPLSLFFAQDGTFASSLASEQKVDTVAQVPYLSLGSPVYDVGCGAQTRYISYEDETSLLAKGKFSRDNGYGGIMVWTIQQGWLSPNAAGGRPQNALMQALRAGFLDP